MTTPNKISDLSIKGLEKVLINRPQQMLQAPFLYQISLKLTRVLIQLKSEFESVSERRNGQIESLFGTTKHHQTQLETIFSQLADLFKIAELVVQHDLKNKEDHKEFRQRIGKIEFENEGTFNSIFEQLDEFAKEISELRDRPSNHQFQLEAEGWELIAIIPSGIDARSLCEILGAIEGGPRESRIESNAFGKIGIFRKAVENV